MRFVTRLLADFALAGLPALSGCATPRTEIDSLVEHNAWVKKHADALALRTDGDSLLARALAPRPLPISDDYSDPALIAALSVNFTDVEQLDEAATQAPENATILAFRLLGCLAVEGCDAATAAESLARADPGNGLALVPRLRDPLRSETEAVVDEALEALGREPDFRTHSNAAAIIAVDALVNTTYARRSRHARELESVSWLTAVIGRQSSSLFAAFTDVVITCHANVSPTPHAACSQARLLLMRSDSLLVQMAAAGQACRVAAADSVSTRRRLSCGRLSSSQPCARTREKAIRNARCVLP